MCFESFLPAGIKSYQGAADTDSEGNRFVDALMEPRHKGRSLLLSGGVLAKGVTESLRSFCPTMPR
jgi:hypothetical protein